MDILFSVRSLAEDTGKITDQGGMVGESYIWNVEVVNTQAGAVQNKIDLTLGCMAWM